MRRGRKSSRGERVYCLEKIVVRMLAEAGSKAVTNETR